ncbi:MAG: hypothetical protein CMK23_06670 [Porticoccaceae bacterium]|nr:hypothetical protein [Porticoccaceae bacterium]|tara:strand:- start:5336 stop:5596 length:261 start_codon:yes stop_codon:yes gene_type:complete
MVDETSDDSLDEQTMEMYQRFFDRMILECSTNSSIAVAGTMIGLAMRLYRTSLDDKDYTEMMDYITTNQDLIEPFSLMEFESPTIH